MRVNWQVSAVDIRKVKRLMAEAAKHPLVVRRRQLNLGAARPRVTKGGFWHALAGALLTTQQRSGPGRPVTRFLATRPFPLSFKRISNERDVAPFVTRTLSKFGGIRRSTLIGEELETNLQRLEDGLWTKVLAYLAELRKGTTPALEREVADFLDDNLAGIGPKQSRNLIQGLGLTRYEIPLDSRLTKWLNAFGFPITLSAAGLADRHYYQLVSDGVQALCAAAKVPPCLFDAAVFVSFDTEEWTDPASLEWGDDS